MTMSNLVQKDVYERMNYLFQAANVNLSTSPSDLSITNDCCHQLLAISKRAVLKLDPSIKRSLCKRCNALLIPGITATTRIRSMYCVRLDVRAVARPPQPLHCAVGKPCTRLVTTCLLCKTRKIFNCRPGYTIWSERHEAIIHPDIEPSESSKVEATDAADQIISKPGESDLATSHSLNSDLKIPAL